MESQARLAECDETRLQKRFYIDPHSPSGLRWKSSHRKNNVGQVAGYRRSGKWIIPSGNLRIQSSRIVWILSRGQIPDGFVVDHRDGNKDNNAISNLQLLTVGANCRARNQPPKQNTSGFMGVSFYKPTGKWKACIERDRIQMYLGYFDSPVEAARAYNLGAIKWAEQHGEAPRYLNPV